MEDNKTDSLSRPARFEGKMRHYHQSSRVTDHSDWDEWVGDEIKSPWRQKMDNVILRLGTIAVGLLLLGGVVLVIFMVLKKILPIFGK